MRPDRRPWPSHLRTALAATLVATGLSLGCAFGEIRLNDPLDRAISLEEAQNRYTVLVRWSDFERAAGFVDPEQRKEFLRNFPSFREVRFTDFESETADIGEDGTATVEVTYFAYTPTSPLEVTITETQYWYRDSKLGNDWRVRPTFRGLDALVASGPSRELGAAD